MPCRHRHGGWGPATARWPPGGPDPGAGGRQVAVTRTEPVVRHWSVEGSARFRPRIWPQSTMDHPLQNDRFAHVVDPEDLVVAPDLQLEPAGTDDPADQRLDHGDRHDVGQRGL